MGSIVMGIWFILFGIFNFVAVPQSGMILAILAIVAGILVLVGR